MVTKVIAYARVSTDRQTLENQRSEILRYASSHGLVIDYASGMSVSYLSKKYSVSRDTMTRYLEMSLQDK